MPVPAITRWHDDGLTVDIGFPGGNLLVDSIAAGVLTVRQDQRDTPLFWFYWAFRLVGAPGRRIEVRFTGGAVVGVRGPAISLDDGATWTWLSAQVVPRGDSFTCVLPADGRPVRFAMGIPHQLGDWERFAAGQPRLRRRTLCTTPRGRPVEWVGIGIASAPVVLLVTARHHSCEAMAGYVLEGLLSCILADPTWNGLAEIAAIPFVDAEGVEDGDQGKGRAPHDHNRDYGDPSIYPEVRAIRAWFPALVGQRRAVVVDLHCPYISGDNNCTIFQVGAAEPGIWEQQQRLATILERIRRGPLPYRATDSVPWGTRWNTSSGYRDGVSLRTWAAQQPQVDFATTIEIPYADADGIAVDPTSARAFGTDLANALGVMLREGSRRLSPASPAPG